jgi:hypothetical protein
MAEETVDVVIAYDANDLSNNGKTRALPAAEAKELVREGRARYADESTTADRADGGGSMGDSPAAKPTAKKAAAPGPSET